MSGRLIFDSRPRAHTTYRAVTVSASPVVTVQLLLASLNTNDSMLVLSWMSLARSWRSTTACR